MDSARIYILTLAEHAQQDAASRLPPDHDWIYFQKDDAWYVYGIPETFMRAAVESLGDQPSVTIPIVLPQTIQTLGQNTTSSGLSGTTASTSTSVPASTSTSVPPISTSTSGPSTSTAMPPAAGVPVGQPIPAQITTLPLPNTVFAGTQDGVYDLQWMRNKNVAEALAHVKTSKDHTMTLCREGAIVIGDELWVTFKQGRNGPETEKCGKVIQGGTKAQPDVELDPDVNKADRLIQKWDGPRMLVEAMKKFHTTIGEPTGSTFKHVRLARNGTIVGTLHDVRQAHELWYRQRDLWKKRTGNLSGRLLP